MDGLKVQRVGAAGNGEIVKTTWKNTGSGTLSPSAPRTMPQEVWGKEMVVLYYNASSADNRKMILLTRGLVVSRGYVNTSMSYDPDTGVWSNTSSNAYDDKDVTYQVVAI